MKRLLIGCCLLAFGLWAAPLSAQPDITDCSAPGTVIDDGVVTTDTITVVTSLAIDDLDVSVDATFGFLGDFIISVTSPTGTAVELLAFDGGGGTVLNVTFDDSGVAQPPLAGYGCDCAVVANGLLGATAGELSDGLWTLTLDDTFVGSPTGVLNEWCVLITAPCSSPGTAIPDFTTITDTIVVANSIFISDTQVSVDITHTWISDVEISVESPAATSVLLFDNLGGSADNIIVTFSEAGEVQPPLGGYTCDCPVMPASTLTALNGESSSGTWTLSITDSVGGDTGTLNEWCVNLSALAPVLAVSGLTCSDAGGGVIDFSATAGSDYASIDVLVNGALDSTLGSYLAGDPIAASTVGSYGTPQNAEICLVPTGSAGGLGPESCCTTAIFGTADYSDCGGTSTIGDGGSVSDLLFSFTSVIIADIVVTVDLTTSWSADHSISLTAPSGTAVTLHSFGGSLEAAIDVRYWQLGGINTFPYDCGGCLMQASGPGSLLDFLGEDTAPAGFGVWIFFVSDSATFSGGATVNDWCIDAYASGPAFAVSDLACTIGVAAGTVDASWTHTTNYDDVEVYENGVLVASLGPATIGTTGSYTSAVYGGTTTVEICVRGINAGVPGPDACCQGLVLEPVDSQACDTPALLFDGPFPETDTALGVTILDALTISEVEVYVNLTSTFAADYTQTIASPAGTVVSLNLSGFGTGTNILILWDEDGAPLTFATDLGCACAVAPEGDLGDFGNEVSLGTWTLTLNPGFTVGTLNEWCVRINGCALAPPDLTSCAAAGSDIVATWGEPDVYDTVDVLLDGGIAATLAGGVGSYTIAGVADGRHTVQIVGNSVAAGCSAASSVCRAAVGFIEYCVEDFALNDDSLGSATDTVSFAVAESIVVGDVDVLLQFNTGFTGDDDFALTSPFGTAVQLHNNGGTDLAFDLIWTDAGAPNTGAPGNYDCGGCSVMPSGPGSFADFFGELTDGTWSIDNGTTFNGPGQSIDLVCLGLYEGCTVFPPVGKTCTVVGDDILLGWTNGQVYDAIDIERNGVNIATVAGTDTSYLDVGPAAGDYTYRVFGSTIADGCSSGSALCSTLIGIVEACSAPALDLPDGVPTSDIIAVGDAFRLSDLQARVDITEDFATDLGNVDLLSPSGTMVTLYDGATGTGANVDATFGDAGTLIDFSVPMDCNGCLLAPTGPGAMADFVPELVTGDWTLTALGTFGPATLNEWCLRMFEGCPVAPPTGLSCTDDGFEVDLAWALGEAYDSQEVYEDGVLIATIGGAATSFSTTPIPGYHTYLIRGLVDAEECGNSSDECDLAFVRQETCDAPALFIAAGVTDFDVITVADSFTLNDVDASVDVTISFVTDLDLLTLTSPSGVVVTLYDGIAGTGADMDATFHDSGIVAGFSTNFVCDPCLIAPTGPGALADFAGELSDGDWTLTLTPFTFGSGATLNEWCVGLFDVNPPVPPIVDNFKRGNARGMDPFNALLDALFILNWQFSMGPEPPCWNAADADGNNILNALIDALFILNYQFSMGPTPPAPGPDVCGADPDGLDVLVGGVPTTPCPTPPAYCNP